MSSSEDESMASEIDEQEQNGGRGIPDYIMNLEDVPSTLPTHLELQKTRVFCNLDAPQHVTIYLSSPFHYFLILQFFFSNVTLIFAISLCFVS